jgi:pyridoxal 5'-phosphate synthase pdxS subunit
MATELPTTNGHSAQDGENNFAVKAGLARMLKGGVIMDVVNAEQVSSYNETPFSSQTVNANTQCQARIAEEAGASAVMALERVPADIRSQGGVARMSDPKMIKEIMDTVTIPVMAKARIGHFVECQVPISFSNPPISQHTNMAAPRSSKPSA